MPRKRISSADSVIMSLMHRLWHEEHLYEPNWRILGLFGYQKRTKGFFRDLHGKWQEYCERYRNFSDADRLPELRFSLNEDTQSILIVMFRDWDELGETKYFSKVEDEFREVPSGL